MKCTEKTKKLCGTSYRWDSMPLGLKTAPALWMQNMREGMEIPITQKYLEYMHSVGRHDEDGIVPLRIYIDDCLLHIKTVEDHKILLKIYLEQASKMWPTISIHKSFIGKKKVNLLGSELSAGVIEPKPKRMSKLLAISPPRNISELTLYFMN